MLTLALVVSLGVNAFLLLTLSKMKRKVQAIMSENSQAFDGLEQDVHNESSAVDSAIVLINGLSSRLTEALAQSSGDDLVARITALRDEINQRNVALAQAVAAGTAAENDSSSFPTPEPTPSESSPETPVDSSSESTETPSSDTSVTSDTTDSDSSSSVETSVESPVETPAEEPIVTEPESPASDGSADVEPPASSDSPPSE